MADFLAGRSDEAMARNNDFAALATIQAVDTELENDLNVQAEEDAAVSITAPADGELAAESAPAAPGLLDQLLNGLLQAVRDSRGASAKLVPHLKSLFSRLQDQALGTADADARSALIDGVAGRLFPQLGAAPAATPGILLQA